MEFIKVGNDAGIESAGGKGYNLLKLARQSYSIPRFVVIPSEFLLSLQDLSQQQQLFSIENIIPRITAEIGDAKLFAVRSSVSAEDGNVFSFAGQFKTHLNVSQNALATAILEVYHSAFNESTNAYRNFANSNELRSAVIIQEMIQATASGVAFGINPLNGSSEEVVINAVNGLGDKLVAGEVNADSYIVNRSSKSYTSEMASSIPVLTDEQVRQVLDLVVSVETLYKSPQDIEFAFLGEQLFLLQSRAVTAKSKAKKTIWDNSNIVESYPGITLPLTSSFIDKAYASVYKQLCAVLGVSKKKIAANNSLFESLLGFINGRVYYNLNSWFGILALLPGYSLNAGFMEKMMGVKEKPLFDDPVSSSKKSIGGYIEVLNAIRCILYNLVTANRQRKNFIKEFNGIYAQYASVDYNKMSLNEIWRSYVSFERVMIERWKAPLVNDFFTMIYFGVLQKYCTKYFPDEKNICNELIASSKDIITTEPARVLPVIAKQINDNLELRDIFISRKPQAIWDLLQSERFTTEYTSIKNYIDKWGERCMAELKLETITYKQDPLPVIEILQAYLNNGIFYFVENASVENKKLETEAKMFQIFKRSPLQRIIFKHILNKTRYFISNRENLRFFRTKGFGVVRQMMLAMGKKLQEQGTLKEGRDIFYFRIDEIKEIVANSYNVSLKAEERRKQYQFFSDLPVEERIVTTTVTDKYFVQPTTTGSAAQKLSMLHGVPCSPGIVTAKVRAVTHVKQVNDLNNEIMATYATDPGWVVLFPSASGILTEKGSLLSHAAIVSREMGIPCIVGLTGLMDQVKDGDTLIMDGSTGIVNIIKDGDEC
jgi:pyruvate,water dikinase